MNYPYLNVLTLVASTALTTSAGLSHKVSSLFDDLVTVVIQAKVPCIRFDLTVYSWAVGNISIPPTFLAGIEFSPLSFGNHRPSRILRDTIRGCAVAELHETQAVIVIIFAIGAPAPVRDRFAVTFIPVGAIIGQLCSSQSFHTTVELTYHFRMPASQRHLDQQTRAVIG